MQPILDIRNFSKSYDGKTMAVDGLSLTIEPGDIYGFIGKNGAGKTTTLRAAAGILRFDMGICWWTASAWADPSPASAKSPTSPITPTCTRF